jgi:hypothetical protein
MERAILSITTEGDYKTRGSVTLQVSGKILYDGSSPSRALHVWEEYMADYYDEMSRTAREEALRLRGGSK